MPEHIHAFYVFSTATQEAAIMVLCRCGQFGIVDFDDYTEEEWRQAFSAPECPYRWQDNHRVTLKHDIGPDGAGRYLPPVSDDFP